MKKIVATVATFGLVALAFAGCGTDKESAATTAASQTSEPAAPASSGGSGKKVAYLINGALGDKSFYDSGKAGIDAIAAKYGVETRTIEASFDAAKYEPSLKAAVEYADVIYVISYGFEDQLKAAADANPNKVFINIDTVVENPKKTITSVDFIEEEGAYLAGAAAALATTDASLKGTNPDKKIGVVGGDNNDPVIKAFLGAYEKGAKSVDAEIVVEAKDLGGAWDDQAKAKQAASQLFASGNDVVFQVAAAAGLGVLQAAEEQGFYAIGVDADQYELAPKAVIASDIKNVGKSIEDTYATVADGSYRPGATLTYGLSQGGVDLVTTGSPALLSVDVIAKIAALRASIVAGDVSVR